jgi:hypothetical protein
MATTEHKEGKATVKVVFYTYKTLADGTHPFMVRITKDRKLKILGNRPEPAPEVLEPAQKGKYAKVTLKKPVKSCWISWPNGKPSIVAPLIYWLRLTSNTTRRT